MLSLPSPRSSKLTTRAPSLLTLEVAAWNFGASAHAGSASAKTAISVAVGTRILRRDLRMVLLFVGLPRLDGRGARVPGQPDRSAPTLPEPSRGGALPAPVRGQGRT